MNRLITHGRTKASETLSPAASLKLREHARAIHVRTDRMFAVLMVLQWLGGIVTALTVSPLTWIGAKGELHPHVLMAAVGGGVLAAAPIALSVFAPGRLVTRMVIASSQVLFSSLLIHLSGGRIETHFHVFGSLAFLSAYRDPRVLAPATLIVAADHFCARRVVAGVGVRNCNGFGVALAGARGVGPLRGRLLAAHHPPELAGDERPGAAHGRPGEARG